MSKGSRHRHRHALGAVFQFTGGACGQADELGQRVVLSAPVDAVVQRKSGVEALSCGRTFTGRAAIVAMSPALADRIELSPPLYTNRRLLQRLWVEGANVKTLLIYNRPWWRDQGLAGFAIRDRPGAALVMDCSGPDATEGVLAAFSASVGDVPASARKDAGARRALLLDDLVHYFGEAARHPRQVAALD